MTSDRFYARCAVCGYYETTHQSELLREVCGIDHDFVMPEPVAAGSEGSSHD